MRFTPLGGQWARLKNSLGKIREPSAMMITMMMMMMSMSSEHDQRRIDDLAVKKFSLASRLPPARLFVHSLAGLLVRSLLLGGSHSLRSKQTPQEMLLQRNKNANLIVVFSCVFFTRCSSFAIVIGVQAGS